MVGIETREVIAAIGVHRSSFRGGLALKAIRTLMRSFRSWQCVGRGRGDFGNTGHERNPIGKMVIRG
jgi:hypothetical protein